MRRHLRILCLFAAWLCANGAVLDVGQIFAWARMFAGYAHTMPVGEALARTFDPAKPCPICLAVEKARDESATHQPPATTAAAAERILLICQQSGPLLLPPDPAEWPEALPAFAPSRRDPVPRPPPRVRCA